MKKLSLTLLSCSLLALSSAHAQYDNEDLEHFGVINGPFHTYLNFSTDFPGPTYLDFNLSNFGPQPTSEESPYTFSIPLTQDQECFTPTFWTENVSTSTHIAYINSLNEKPKSSGFFAKASERIAETCKNAVASIGKLVFNQVKKEAYNLIINPIYNNLVSPVTNAAYQLGTYCVKTLKESPSEHLKKGITAYQKSISHTGKGFYQLATLHPINANNHFALSGYDALRGTARLGLFGLSFVANYPITTYLMAKGTPYLLEAGTNYIRNYMTK